MVEEIVYTSAEKGLKQGSRGFCTVVSTAGMSLALAERLESMSGYRHAFPLHDPQASMNPVCFSHVTTRLAGKTLHVISRVADAGQDYTGRSNKLAHHLVIDNVAGMPAGPARLMSEPGVIVERWDGNVRNIPPRELRCAPLPASIPLVAWQSLTGDEGWAGSVAEQLLQNPAPVSIIFKPGTDTLTLVREVLDLIPAPQRWNVTFSTYFTRLLAGAECQLRFVLNDTPEATSLRNDARARVIDLTSSLPAATGGTLVAMARKGQLTPQEPAPAPTAPVVRSRTSVEISTKDTGVEISIPKLKPSPSPLETPDKPLPPRDLPPPVRVNSRKGLWIGLTVAALLVVVTGTLIFMRSGNKPDPFADLVSQAVPQDKPPSEAELEVIRASEQAERERLDQEKLEREAKLAAEEATKKKTADDRIAADKLAADQQAERLRQEAMKAQAKAALEAAMREEGPFAFIKKDPNFKDAHNQWLFDLPTDDSVNPVRPLPLRLTDDQEPKKVSLSLCPAAASLFENCDVKHELTQSPGEPNSWIATAGTLKLAEYTLEKIESPDYETGNANYQINFKWLPDSRKQPQAQQLRWWPLKVDIAGRSAVFIQRSAFRPTQPITWDNLTQKQIFQFARGEDLKALSLNAELDLTLDLIVLQPGHDPVTLALPINEKAHDAESPKDEDDENGIELEKENKYFFLLNTPFSITPKLPDDKSSLIAFGTLTIWPTIDENDGLRFRPDIKIYVRIPKKHHINSLPSPNLIAGVEELTKAPDRFFSDVAGSINEDNNPTKDWPLLQLRYNTAMAAMKENVDAFRTSVEFWHSQSLQPLTIKKEEFSSSFGRKANAALKAIEAIIPELEVVARQQQTIVAQQNLRKAQEYATAISKYKSLLRKAIDDVAAQITLLTADYDDIEDAISAFNEAAATFTVRCSLRKVIETPGSESGQKLTIYLIESDSTPIP